MTNFGKNIYIVFSMDVRIEDENMICHYCVRAIIEQDEKILVIRVNDAPYYHLPGGHVKIGETSQQALLREIKEEVGFEIVINQLVVVDEGFYTKNDMANHALIFYYLAKPLNKVETKNFIRLEQDGTKKFKNELCWFTREELKHVDLRPAHLKDLIIKNEISSLIHVINH